MIVAWWQLNMDAKRVLSLGVGIAGVALVGLSLATTRGFPGWTGGVGSVVSIALGSAIGGYATHRGAGGERRLYWAATYGGIAFATSGYLYLAQLVFSPLADRSPSLADASLGIAAIGVILWSVAAFLWERDARGRVVAAVEVLVIGAVFVGFIALLDGGRWAEAGAAILTVGVIALLARIAFRVLDW